MTEAFDTNSDDAAVCELTGLRAGTAHPRTEAFGVNSEEASVWELNDVDL